MVAPERVDAEACAGLVPVAHAFASPTNGSTSLDIQVLSPARGGALFPAPAGSRAAIPALRVASNLQFSEGPVYLPAPHNAWVFSDIPARTTFQYTPASRDLAVFQAETRHQNGNFWDPVTKTILACEHGARALSRIDPVTRERVVAVDSLNGLPLTSPNDVTVKSDGAIFFTDPQYGMSKHQGHGGPRHQPCNQVLRLDPQTGIASAVIGDLEQPNGLCFSPDERTLYVADSGAVNCHCHYNPDGPRTVYAYDASPDGTVFTNRREFAHIDPGIPDGVRCDVHGNVYVTTWDGVHVFGADGEPLAKILTHKPTGNCAFGGQDMKSMLICACDEVYLVELNVQGRP